ncbi:MAG: response regulator, partial [Pirellulaceae bacterium]|nr:response regulator [Pirellulaceae bacterium]
SFVERTFRHVAESKNVDFVTRFDTRLPKSMLTDAKRLQQIIKNLLSNSFKFTHHGHVTLTVEPVEEGWNPYNEELNKANGVLSFEVSDTGIGIASDKQQIIFEAFQQADGSTSRKYGGTGLGLAISRELSRLLGGEIRLISTPSRGSTFTLFLPTTFTPPRPQRKPAAAEPQLARALASPEDVSSGNGHVIPAVLESDLLEAEPDSLVNEVGDDRDQIEPGDRVLLIVENDVGFARFLLDTARERGLKGLVTSLGAAALTLAREYKPHAITLDIYLPDMEGWRVLERLKNDVNTRHVPVCVISTDEARERAFASGALAFVPKPIQSREVLDQLLEKMGDFIARRSRQIVVVDANAERRARTASYLPEEEVQVTGVADVAAAAALFKAGPVDCIIASPEATALLDDLAGSNGGFASGLSRLPVIVYSEVEGEAREWRRLSDACTVRRVQSPDRLLDFTAFFTHMNVAHLPDDKRQILLDLHESDKVLAGRKVLIVDDDMRNIFALSTVLEEHNMEIVSADNGRDAINILREQTDIEVVLMDIMMPEMDGMETMREIRKIASLKDLPIVAVTAKAMKGDREKCIEAGAWDYLSKPVDTEQMLAVLRAWLHQ